MAQKSKISLLFFFLLILGSSIQAQAPFGIPFTKNYTKKHYAAATQNWQGLRDRNGVVYFANNNGLLSYNGLIWQLFPQEKYSSLRSIALDSSGIIYAGGQNEIGFFAPDTHGKWVYHNLTHKIPKKDQNFDDIWDVIIHQGVVYFRANKKIFRYENGVFSIISAHKYFPFIGILNGEVIVQDGLTSIFSLSSNNKKHFDLPKNDLITSITPINNNTELISTLNNGLFLYQANKIKPWAIDQIEFLKKNDTYTTYLLADGNIAIGTLIGGFLIISPSGKTIFHIKRSNGLQNNSIRCIFQDKNNNIWLGLDNGISLIEYNSPFTFFAPDANIESTGYAAAINDEHFFFGTANGVYSRKLGSSEFTKVQNTEGQVRNINIINKITVVSHHKHALKIVDGTAIPISPNKGSWVFQSLLQDTNFVIAGTYNGISLYDKNLKFINKIKGFDESSRFLEQDQYGNIWVAHPNKGIFKLSLNKDKSRVAVTKYGQKDGLPSNLLNHVFKIGNELFFPTSKGVFSYNYKKKIFEYNIAFNKLLNGKERIRRLIDAPNKDIWYIGSKEIGKLIIKDNSISKQIKNLEFPQISDQLVEGFEALYPVGDDAILPAEQGFIYYNSQKKWSKNLKFGLVFSDICLTNHGDSTIFSGYFYNQHQVLQNQPDSAIIKFPFSENAIRFSYSATKFIRPENTQYRYKLLGLSDKWSAWSPKQEKEYNNLKGGNYTFIVQAMDENNKKSHPISYQFRITPAWYASNLAYFIYFLLFSGLLYFIYNYYNKKYTQQKEIVQRSEEIIDQLKNEKLKAEILHKNRELVSASLHLAHKNEVFKKIKADVDKLTKTCTDLKTKANLDAIIKILSTEEDSQDGWNEFVTHFNKLHTGFFDKLKEKHPTLTPKDLKMCAYLRMNLSTKEISNLTNISTRGVEGARYRLRKKFGLSSDDNLVAFLMDVV